MMIVKENKKRLQNVSCLFDDCIVFLMCMFEINAYKTKQKLITLKLTHIYIYGNLHFCLLNQHYYYANACQNSTFQRFAIVDHTRPYTNYKSAISSIHQDVVRTVIESSSSKLLNGRPPTIATAEQTLPRKTRTILAQLHTGHSRILGQYMNRIDPTKRNHCHNYGHSPHDTHHLFDCPSKPTTLTVESLWTAPFETAKHLNLAIDETS